MADRTIPRPPAGLGAPGKKLWRDLHLALADDAEFDEREQTLLAVAAHQADDVARLERSLKGARLIVGGSTGQPRLHPAVAELRQARLALARLLSTFELEDLAGAERSLASRRAGKAADARWRRRDDLADRRRRAADAS